MSKEIEFWGIEDQEHLTCTDKNEAIEEILDDIIDEPFPRTLEICGYCRMKINAPSYAEYIASRLLECWDEKYGNEDSDYSDPTEEMIKLAETFTEGMAKLYEVGQCEVVYKETIDVSEWVKKNAPQWVGRLQKGNDNASDKI